MMKTVVFENLLLLDKLKLELELRPELEASGVGDRGSLKPL